MFHRMSILLLTSYLDTQLLLMLLLFEEKEQMKLRDFQVRRAVVPRALQWLIVNNLYYNDVVINNNV